MKKQQYDILLLNELTDLAISATMTGIAFAALVASLFAPITFMMFVSIVILFSFWIMWMIKHLSNLIHMMGIDIDTIDH